MTTSPAYERDPYLRSLDARIVDAGVDGGRAFVVLSDTVLHPGGGGQPADGGSINGVAALDAGVSGDVVRWFVAAPLPPGPARVELDWIRRFDHMQQHTGQHLLTALAQDRFGWPTTAFHLGERLSDIELDVAALTAGELVALEEAVAAEIRAARPVTTRRVPQEALGALPVRTRGLPDGFRGEVRLVDIAGVDLNTCGATHVRSTAELEALKLLATEPLRGGTRLYFVVGTRVRSLLAAHEARNAELRRLLGAPDDGLPATVAAKLDQLKEALRRTRGLEEELAQRAAEGLALQGETVVAAHWDDQSPAFLERIARELTRLDAEKLVLLTAGPGDVGHYLLWAGPNVVVDIQAAGREVTTALAGRGGGGGGRKVFQGKASALSRRGDALALLRATLRTP